MKGTAKDNIFAAAAKLLGQLGYAETTYKKVAREAGVTEGLIAHHFGSKEKLFLKVEQTILRDLHDKLEESLFYSSDGMGAVTNFIKCFLRYSVDNKEWFTTLLRCSPFILESSPKDHKVISVECEKIFRLLKNSVTQGIEDHTLKDCDPHMITYIIFSTMIGATRANNIRLKTPANFYPEIVSFFQNMLTSGH
ncbi:MAG: TetR/AcrR family transcriptional regulator [Desulfoplanes sp.]|nr:TetR/AcrR family transcriptional regulator [Desulfoplanes sp.]MDD4648918.1 TetR/AcrR family transcriptional regulator [Desulfoplanes sp.]